jgi:hypothetical protein
MQYLRKSYVTMAPLSVACVQLLFHTQVNNKVIHVLLTLTLGAGKQSNLCYSFLWSGDTMNTRVGLTALHYFMTDRLTNYMEQSPSWEANSHSTSQGIHHLLWNQRLTDVFTRACQWSLSWDSCSQSAPFHPVSLRSILTLPSEWSLPFRFSDQNFVYISQLFHVCCVPYPFNPWFGHPNNMWWSVQVMKLLIKRLHKSKCHFVLQLNKQLL